MASGFALQAAPPDQRQWLGCSCIIVNATFMEQFASVVELLAGR